MVTGTDLSPIQPPWIPPNCKFVVDDAETDLADPTSQQYDFIHARGMCGSIKDWPKLYNDIYKNLKPGGWVEIQEYETLFTPNEGTLECIPLAQEWSNILNNASVSFGKKLDVARDHEQHMINAGFIDVVDLPKEARTTSLISET